MSPREVRLKTSFTVESKYEPYFTGGRIQVTNDGELLLCQCGDRVQLVEAGSGKVVKSLTQDEDEVITFVLAPNSEIVVTSHKSGLLRHWNVSEGSVVRTWKSMHLTPVTALAFDSTSTLLASGGTDGSLKVWDIQRQYCTHNLKGGSGVYTTIKFHPDINRLLIYGASMDCSVLCWNLRASNVVGTLKGHLSAVTDMVFFEELNQAATCGRDNVIILWNLDNYTSLRTVPTYESLEALVPIALNSNYPELNVVSSSNRPHVISAGEKGYLRVWDLSSAKEVYTQTDSLVSQSDVAGTASITSMLFNQAKNEIFVVSFDHNIIVHNLSDFVVTKQFAGYNEDILDIVWLGKGDTHLAVATNSQQIKVYDVATMNCTLLRGHTDLVLALAVSRADRNLLLSSSKDNSIRLWKMESDPFRICCVAEGQGHTGSVGAVALSQSQLSFAVSGSQDRCLKLWKLPSNLQSDICVPLHVLRTSIAHEKDINAVAVSPNDKLVASASQDKTAKIWNSADLQLLGVLRGHKRGLWSVQFSTADQIVATASTDGTIKLWALTDYSCIKTFEGHDSSVLRMCFVSRGQQLLSSASDGLVKLWNIKSSECVATLDEHQSKVWALAVGEADTKIATGGADSTFIVWKDITEEEREKEAQKWEAKLLEEQQLANLMQQGLLLEALRLAVDLQQPFRTLTILKEVLSQGGPLLDKLGQTVFDLNEEQKNNLLKYAATWNTNSRNCREAQVVLNILLKNHTPEELLAMPSLRSSLSSFLLYSDRHMQRLTRLQQGTQILPYMAARIQATSVTAMEVESKEE